MGSIQDRLPILEPDGLLTPVVGEWGYHKYVRMWMYAQICARSMKRKFETVYLDLFSGAGRAVLQDTGRTVPGSPLLALNVPDPFSRYIFCEENTAKLDALRARVTALAPRADVHYISGDVNCRTDEIEKLLPRSAVTFCFVDPYSINIRLATLRRLSHGRMMDFLILLAVQMDVNRNRELYSDEDSTKLDVLFGDSTWRDRWHVAQAAGAKFKDFVLDEYFSAMAGIGYGGGRREDLYQVRNERAAVGGRRGSRGVPIYWLAFFSKSQLAKGFWKDVLKYNDEALDLFG